MQQQQPSPRNTAYFNSLVFEVQEKRLEADAVVFRMNAEWLTKDRADREADITTLRAHLDREGVDAVRLVDDVDGTLASVDAAGSVTWVREKLKAGEMLKVGEVDRDPIGEVGAPEPEGTLDKPMTAEELRKSSSD